MSDKDDDDFNFDDFGEDFEEKGNSPKNNKKSSGSKNVVEDDDDISFDDLSDSVEDTKNKNLSLEDDPDDINFDDFDVENVPDPSTFINNENEEDHFGSQENHFNSNESDEFEDIEAEEENESHDEEDPFTEELGEEEEEDEEENKNKSDKKNKIIKDINDNEGQKSNLLTKVSIGALAVVLFGGVSYLYSDTILSLFKSNSNSSVASIVENTNVKDNVPLNLPNVKGGKDIGNLGIPDVSSNDTKSPVIVNKPEDKSVDNNIDKDVNKPLDLSTIIKPDNSKINVNNNEKPIADNSVSPDLVGGAVKNGFETIPNNDLENKVVENKVDKPNVETNNSQIDKNISDKVALLEKNIVDINKKIDDIKNSIDVLNNKPNVVSTVPSVTGNDVVKSDNITIIPPVKPQILKGLNLKGVANNMAWVDTVSGVVEVKEGDNIKNGGTVVKIKKYRDKWYVITTTGLIISK